MKSDLHHQSARLQYFMYEAESWERLLVFCKEELVHFKNRLAETIADNEGEFVLLVAEKFQEEFLAQDRIFFWLSDELKKQTRLLQKDMYVDGELFHELVQNQIKLRREIKKTEVLFTETKNCYALYLNERYAVEAD